LPNYGRSLRLHRHEVFDGHAFKGDRREECVQMLAKMARSAPSAAVRSVNGDDSRPRRQLGLPKRGENAKIRGGSEFIRRIPAQELPQ
jgi:hypothetical protein